MHHLVAQVTWLPGFVHLDINSSLTVHKAKRIFEQHGGGKKKLSEFSASKG
jgi:hypothetical protein